MTARCTRVDVYRDGSNGSTALPSLFGPILGVNSQQVRATATSVTLTGNATPCLSPIAFADDWDENRNPPDEFNRYVRERIGRRRRFFRLRATTISRRQPTYAGRTTVSLDFGERIVWTIDHPLTEPITRGLMVPLTLPGGRTFEQNMATCVGQPTSHRPAHPDGGTASEHRRGRDRRRVQPRSRCRLRLWRFPDHRQLCSGLRAR